MKVDDIFDIKNNIGILSIDDPENIKNQIVEFIMNVRLEFGQQKIQILRNKIIDSRNNRKIFGPQKDKINTQIDDKIRVIQLYNEIVGGQILHLLQYNFKSFGIEKYFVHEVKDSYNSIFLEVSINYEKLELIEKMQISYWIGDGYFIKDPIFSCIDYNFTLS